MLFKLKKKPIILDVGKGTLFKGALSYAINKEMNVYRIDISAALNGFINKSLMIEKMRPEQLGRRRILGVTIVSGGLLGDYENLIVDNLRKPKFIYGIECQVSDATPETRTQYKHGKEQEVSQSSKLLTGQHASGPA